MPIIDRYIIKKFLGTLGFMLLLLSIIVVVIDVQSKSPRIEGNGFTVGYFLIHFYPFWMIYLVITFMSILVFISVIYFTSRMANNTEIVAVISSGASFHRFARPYFIASAIIALFSLATNHYLLPWANVQKNKLEVYTYNEVDREKVLGNVEIATRLSPTEYIFINNYNRKEKRGSSFMFQKFDKNRKLIEEIIANEIAWDEKKKVFAATGYLERKAAKNDTEILSNGDRKELNFGLPPEELFPDGLLGQTKTTPELTKLIQQEKAKGNKNLNTFLNELHQRTSMPVSIIILTLLALSLSSQKKRGGLGLNLAIGIALAFVFVFSFEALKVVAENNTLPPALAMWLPNLVFGPLAAFLYLRRANQ
ncbi:LptF/LptG family permease [Bergeyella sp. RCAD1439]|uniref:LptF/LptG family permease n=1 Tax=Bergeyella anatis TaxID=3113737 RepID=UPI002E190BEF|nr:LptF/LptG family permease [Bergeyella sp. RCAD1439]